MILYSWNPDDTICKRYYYYEYGEIVFSLLVPGVERTGENDTPFHPTIQQYAAADLSDQAAASFLLALTPFADITAWPLPVYPVQGQGNEYKKNSQILREFLCLYFLPRYWYECILPHGDEDSEAAKMDCYRRFFNRFMQMLISTYNKYLPIIKAYKEKENLLMARLGSETRSISRFNDTPQEGGDFSDEQHTTTANTGETTTESDYETPMARLKQIRDNYENLYNAWASDFDRMFTKGEIGL